MKCPQYLYFILFFFLYGFDPYLVTHYSTGMILLLLSPTSTAFIGKRPRKPAIVPVTISCPCSTFRCCQNALGHLHCICRQASTPHLPFCLWSHPTPTLPSTAANMPLFVTKCPCTTAPVHYWKVQMARERWIAYLKILQTSLSKCVSKTNGEAILALVQLSYASHLYKLVQG